MRFKIQGRAIEVSIVNPLERKRTTFALQSPPRSALPTQAPLRGLANTSYFMVGNFAYNYFAGVLQTGLDLVGVMMAV